MIIIILIIIIIQFFGRLSIVHTHASSSLPTSLILRKKVNALWMEILDMHYGVRVEFQVYIDVGKELKEVKKRLRLSDRNREFHRCVFFLSHLTCHILCRIVTTYPVQDIL